MRAANEMVNVIRELVKQEVDRMDTTVLCEVVSQEDDNHYSVYVLPDRETVVSNITNMTTYNLLPGDFCYVYKIKNSFANAFICYKSGVTDAEELRNTAVETTITQTNTASILADSLREGEMYFEVTGEYDDGN